MATVYLIHGYIGVGKTNFAKKLEQDTGAVRFTLDEWIVNFYGGNPVISDFNKCESACEKMIQDMATSFLKNNISVIFDFGFWSKKKRDTYREFAATHHAKSVTYDVRCDDLIARQRVLNRSLDMPEGALYIDQNTYENLKKHFEPIEKTEDAIEIN